MWLDHCVQLLQRWAVQDINKLRSYEGDLPGLQGYLKQALNTDKQLSLVGLDTCSQQLHQALWDAIGDALSRRRDRMEKDGLPAVDLMSFMRDAELLGAVSPTLSERCWSNIRQQAVNWAEIYYQAYQRAKLAADAAAKKGDSASLAAAKAAVKNYLSKALNSEKQCDVLGAIPNHSLL